MSGITNPLKKDYSSPFCHHSKATLLLIALYMRSSTHEWSAQLPQGANAIYAEYTCNIVL